ncbi:hypothetical protein E2C01_049582 [Portunus trituberculatus]|uniref:Uncharacterized protein n=1 Tax=Portunus trituberculatus TaxID=210409 RepID=A0A5B7GDI4_PORTR|nr:hypothetical protein [Portunus trituberculatus]
MLLSGDMGPNTGTTINKTACATNGWKLNTEQLFDPILLSSRADRGNTPSYLYVFVKHNSYSDALHRHSPAHRQAHQALHAVQEVPKVYAHISPPTPSLSRLGHLSPCCAAPRYLTWRQRAN